MKEIVPDAPAPSDKHSGFVKIMKQINDIAGVR
jgi:hypothetical protein